MNNLEIANVNKDSQIDVVKTQDTQELQIELLRHKQHIALEVKNAVICEVNNVIAQCLQVMNQEYLNGFTCLENELKIEFQDIKFKFRLLENKVEGIAGRVENFENLIKSQDDNFTDHLSKLREKNVEYQSKISFIKEDLDMIRKDLEKNRGFILDFRENYSERSEKNCDQMKIMINDIKTTLDYLRFDFQNSLNAESLKVDEKLKTLKISIENTQKTFQNSTTRQAVPYQSLNYHQELIDYVHDSISKWFSELNPIRIRLEKLEKNDSFVSELIKSRKN
jgi:hypothetical protein